VFPDWRREIFLVSPDERLELAELNSRGGRSRCQAGSIGPQQIPHVLVVTARILNGEKPAAIAIEHPVFELAVNLKSAERLGMTVPKPALDQAARVIR